MKIDELKHGQKKEFTPSNTKEHSSYSRFLADCSESIVAMQEAKKFLYRGLNLAEEYDVFKGRSRKNREAKDTSNKMQKAMDDLYMKAGFKALRSNSIFCSSEYNTAESYGDVYIIFPVNGFSFTWSPKIYDFYNDMMKADIEDPSQLNISKKQAEKFSSACVDLISDIENNDWRLKGSAPLDASSKIIRILDHIEGTYYFTEKEKAEIEKSFVKIMELHKSIDEKIVSKIIVKGMQTVVKLYKSIFSNPMDVLDRLQYTDKDFAKALSTKNEIIINGEYYAFAYDKYYPYLSHALLGIGKAPDPSKFFDNDDDYYGGYF